MAKLQGIVLNLLSLLALLAAFILIVQNAADTVILQAGLWVFPNVSLGGVMALTAVLMGLSVFSRMLVTVRAARQQHQRTSRELERKDVASEEASERVKVLEAKVQTLEKALSDALKQPKA